MKNAHDPNEKIEKRNCGDIKTQSQLRLLKNEKNALASKNVTFLLHQF